MHSANKPALADAIWALMPSEIIPPTGQSQYVLDGGYLLHRIPWQRGTTYNDICSQYTNYVTRKYEHAIIAFDGYKEELSTKDSAHRRRTGGRAGPTVDFTSDMVMKSKKEDFLSNTVNKQRFIDLLGERLEQAGCETHHATGDADVLIVQTAVQAAANCQTILVGDDTDLLVLLCFHVPDDSCDIFFKPEIKTGTKTPRCWNIKAVQRCLGRDTCNNLLFVHAILGCDTTSRVFSLGKGLALKYIRSDAHFKTQAQTFLDDSATEDDIVRAGEAALVSLYKGTPEDTLDKLRLRRFHQKVATSTSVVQPESLPPTSSAARYHSLRVYLQVQVWTGCTDINQQTFGWKEVEGSFIPRQCDMEVAPKTLLEVVRCNCRTGCEKMRCSCRKAGLECSTGCGECRGICTHMFAVTDDNDDA
jgi:5'-3' exonuclease